MRAVFALALLALGCAYPKPTPVIAQSLEADTHFDTLPQNAGGQGDAAVRVVLGQGRQCTGALIDDAVVLTAQHCLVDDDNIIAPPSHVYVELGKDALPWGRVRVTRVAACGGWQGGADRDIAAVVLSQPIPKSVPRYRIGALPSEGDDVVASGFGRALDVHPMPLTGFAVRESHRVDTEGKVDLVMNEHFELRLPARPGDSGSPVVQKDTGELVALVSAGEESLIIGQSLMLASRLDSCSSMIESVRLSSR